MSKKQHQQRKKQKDKGTHRSRAPLIGTIAPLVLVALLVGSFAVWKYTAAPDTVVPDGFNLLLVTLDTTRADYLGCYGNDAARTPTMDRLAHEGSLFTHCDSCVPITAPSHASIMTAVYPYVHGVRQNGTDRLGPRHITLAETLKEAGFATQAIVSAFVLNGKFGASQGFDVYRDVTVLGSGDPLKAQRKGGETCDDACEMLVELAEQQFFLWVHFFDPHSPYESEQHPNPNSKEAYADEIAYTDDQIDRLCTQLQELGLYKRTLIVIVGDHGEGLGEHQEQEHGMLLYETTLRVPLIFWCPGLIEPAQTIDLAARTIDVAPTILGLLEQPSWQHAQGRSFAPLLTGTQQETLLPVYGESFEAHVRYGASHLRSIRVDGWKYIQAPKPELYHLPSDPDELSNRIKDEPGRAAELRSQLQTLLAEAPPPVAEDVSIALNASEISQLESLGYVASEAPEMQPGLTEIDRFEPRGSNPRDVLPLVPEILRARQAVRTGHANDAIPSLQRLIKQIPDAWRLRADYAEALAKVGRPAEAAAAYGQAAQLAPEDRYIRRQFARFFMADGKPEKAVEQYAAMLQRMPDDTTALHEMAVALIRLERFKEAEENLQLAMRIDPDTPRLLHAMGLLRWTEKRYMEAAPYFRRAIEIDPKYEPSRDALNKLRAAGLKTP